MSAYGGIKWQRKLARDPNVTPNAKAVLLAVWSHADEHGQGAFTSGPKLLTYTGLSERTVRRALAEAITAGYAERATRGGGKRTDETGREVRLATTYRLTMPRDSGHQRPESSQATHGRRSTPATSTAGDVDQSQAAHGRRSPPVPAETPAKSFETPAKSFETPASGGTPVTPSTWDPLFLETPLSDAGASAPETAAQPSEERTRWDGSELEIVKAITAHHEWVGITDLVKEGIDPDQARQLLATFTTTGHLVLMSERSAYPLYRWDRSLAAAS